MLYGCMLTVNGRCVDASFTSTDRDALQFAAETGALNASSLVIQLTPKYTSLSFYGNATYCSATDAACTACRREFDRMVRDETTREALDTSFCLGSDGQCICSGVCEVPAYRAMNVIDTECENSQIGATLRVASVFFKSIAEASWPARSSPRRDPRAPLLPEMLHRRVNETCAFYGQIDTMGCDKPRALRDCLRKRQCMISQGACVDAKNPTTDLRNMSELPMGTSSRYQQISSDDSSVCGLHDESCSFCSTDIEAFETNQASWNATARCIGTGGCICDQYLLYLDNTKDDSLSGLLGAGCSAKLLNQFVSQEDSLFISILVGFTAVIALVFGCTRYAIVRSRLKNASRIVQDQAARLVRHMLEVVPRGLDLDLFGWRLFQRRLEYQEQRLLRREDNLSPVTYPMDLKDAWVPSAPNVDLDQDYSAPTKENPMALASAPNSGGEVVDTNVPSAPRFTAEDDRQQRW